MKNITVFAVLVTIIFLFTVRNPCFGQENENLADNIENLTMNNEDEGEDEKPAPKTKRYGFTLSPQFGFIYGQSAEIVYPTSTKGEYLSELLWDLKPVPYGGIQFEIWLKDTSKIGFFSSLSFKAGIPRDSGIMEDRDWMSNKDGSLTHYSKHTNKTKEFFMADANFGISIPVKFFNIKPFLSVSWMHFSFSGKDGYGIYARKDNSNYYPINDDPTVRSFSGEVIKYKQDWLYAAAGISFGINIINLILLDFSFQISPLTYCSAEDQHLTTKAIYYDYTGFGLYIEPGASVSINLNHVDISLEFAYRHFRNTRGKTYQGYINSSYIFLSPNASGAGLSLMDTRFLFKIRI